MRSTKKAVIEQGRKCDPPQAEKTVAAAHFIYSYNFTGEVAFAIIQSKHI